jgi:hypothetical protein
MFLEHSTPYLFSLTHKQKGGEANVVSNAVTGTEEREMTWWKLSRCIKRARNVSLCGDLPEEEYFGPHFQS